MTVIDAEFLFAALGLPAGAQVGQRVPKKLLVEHGAPTASDKRRINNGVEEVHWLATLKPDTIGVPLFHDEMREYLEIAVLAATLRADAHGIRLTALIHRAVPYPVVLITTQDRVYTLSLAHKRWSQGEIGVTVLDGEVTTVNFEPGQCSTADQSFAAALAVAHQPRSNLRALYQGWIDTIMALQAARITGMFTLAESPAQAAARQVALVECGRIETHMSQLRAAATKEKQIAKQVALNLELKHAQAAYAATRARL